MNWAFELLGLRPDADVADVKRAYARLLRITRPDDDPEAFQRLHMAYKIVLAHISAKATAAIMPTPTVVTHAEPTSRPPVQLALPTHADTTNVTEPVVHLGTLTNEIIRAAIEAQNSEELSRWLKNRPEFWSIQIKQQAAQLVLQRLFQQPQAIAAHCMDAMLKFFDLDHVLSGVNPVALQSLRARQRTLWELRPENHHELARRAGLMHNGRPEVLRVRKDLALLQHPLNWARVTLAAMQSKRAHGLAALVRTLSNNGRLDELPASVNRQHAMFWFRGATGGPLLTRERFILHSLRAGVWAFVTMLAVVVIAMMSAAPDGVHWSEVARVAGILGGGILVLWLLIAGFWWFDLWQGMPESTPSRWPWLRRLAIPLLCVLSFAMYETGNAPYMRWLVMMCFIAAMRKFRRRIAGNGSFFARITASTPAFIWISVWIIAALSRAQGMEDFPLIPILALATFAMSIADLWRHRAYLHPRLARN
ncbi:J domain-containing protein [Dyella acidisoli]|uniref:J domain-containing protein n=1 Tax=Dyella acidisoli TaxID=1867834 RepID=A0ABQ5XSI4_9GAMM|nr:J domain-containing protein [Dyella acidisoli]GLQ94503.1 hypothetical protein GCM10007901_34550 [Dyella acidisoli]